MASVNKQTENIKTVVDAAAMISRYTQLQRQQKVNIMTILCIIFFAFSILSFLFLVCFNYSCHSVQMSCWI